MAIDNTDEVPFWRCKLIADDGVTVVAEGNSIEAETAQEAAEMYLACLLQEGHQFVPGVTVITECDDNGSGHVERVASVPEFE